MDDSKLDKVVVANMAVQGLIEISDIDDMEVYSITDKGRERGAQVMRSLEIEDALLMIFLIKEAERCLR